MLACRRSFDRFRLIMRVPLNLNQDGRLERQSYQQGKRDFKTISTRVFHFVEELEHKAQCGGRMLAIRKTWPIQSSLLNVLSRGGIFSESVPNT